MTRWLLLRCLLMLSISLSNCLPSLTVRTCCPKVAFHAVVPSQLWSYSSTTFFRFPRSYHQSFLPHSVHMSCPSQSFSNYTVRCFTCHPFLSIPSFSFYLLGLVCLFGGPSVFSCNVIHQCTIASFTHYSSICSCRYPPFADCSENRHIYNSSRRISHASKTRRKF